MAYATNEANIFFNSNRFIIRVYPSFNYTDSLIVRCHNRYGCVSDIEDKNPLAWEFLLGQGLELSTTLL